MAEKMPSFKHGGAYWFVDLTTPDAFYILAVLTALSFLLTVEVTIFFSKSFISIHFKNGPSKLLPKCLCGLTFLLSVIAWQCTKKLATYNT